MAEMNQDFRAAKLVTPLGTDELVLTRFEGSEGLSELFEYQIECLSDEKNVNFDDALGKNCTVSMKTLIGEERHFDGILVEAQNLGVSLDAFAYRLVLRPWFWLLSQQNDIKIFNEKSIVDIISEVFGKHGFANFENNLSRSYDPQEYIVQYRESDLDFVSRLMEQHGISYYFKHESGNHTLVMCDEMNTFASLPGGSRPFVGVADHHRRDEERFDAWIPERQLTSGKTSFLDYNFKQPGMDLKAEKTGSKSYENNELEIFEYPGKYIAQGDGAKYAQIQLDESQAQDNHVHASGDCLSSFPGSLMSLEEHPNDVLNTEYLAVHCHHVYFNDGYRTSIHKELGDGQMFKQLTNRFHELFRRSSKPRRALENNGNPDSQKRALSNVFRGITHQLKQLRGIISTIKEDGGGGAASVDDEASEGYEGHYEFVPSDQPYAPQIKTKRPFIRGPQTAKVVGEGEIDVDEHGRILALFHWSRDGGISRRCRLSQVWAGKQWGGIYIPRVGMEVIVQFLEGDPDQPIILGTVYNGDNKPPYSLPDEKNIAGLKSNSTPGGGGYNEYIFDDTKGEELVRQQAEKNMDTLVKNDETRTIGHDRTTHIKNDETHTVDQNQTFSIGVEKNGSRTGDIQVDDTLNVGNKIYIEAGTEIELVVGASSIKMTTSEIKISSINVKIEAGAEFKSTATMSKHSASGIMDIKGSLVKINS